MIRHSPLRAAAQQRLLECLPWLACGLLWLATPAGAQGISPGELPADGYKLPGGIEPIVHLRSYYFDQESLAGKPSTAWALGGWAGLRTPWLGDVVQLGVVGYTSHRGSSQWRTLLPVYQISNHARGHFPCRQDGVCMQPEHAVPQFFYPQLQLWRILKPGHLK